MEMIIEIDDAGTGAPVGGVVIGILKDNHFHYEVIPIKFFQEEHNASNEIIKNEVLKVVMRLLNKVDFDAEQDIIHVCRGDIFRKVREALDEYGYKWVSTKIVSKLQDLVEAAFDFHLIDLGIPRLLVKRLLEYRQYVVTLLKWVALDINSRKKFVKTKFPIWRTEWKYAQVEFQEENITGYPRYYCLECGERIRGNEKIYVANIKTPRKTFRAFLHKSCSEKFM